MSVPAPVFIHHGFFGGACCSCILVVDDSSYLVIGSVRGACKVFSTISQLPVLTAYDDPEHRSIISVGQIKANYLFVHIRSYGVLLLRFYKDLHDLKFETEKLLITKHYGFCRTISYSGCVYIPLYDERRSEVKENLHCQETKNPVKIVDEHWDEQNLDINFDDGKSRGMLMSLSVIDRTGSNNKFLVCCFEEGSLALMDIRLKKLIQLASVRAFEETILACSVFANSIAVSSVKNVIKLYRIGESTMIHEKSVPYPSEVGGCGSLCFSPCGKFLASGYWDGSIRVHSVKSQKLRVVVDFHKDTIDFLDWHLVSGKRLLFACCKDGSLSMWNLFKD
uniref:WD_REPEATS_REGION domain-containing protein n=1 Tax=Syphacia muris TaxID=451379 RepID=A0A0N5AVI8_9BILA